MDGVDNSAHGALLCYCTCLTILPHEAIMQQVSYDDEGNEEEVDT